MLYAVMAALVALAACVAFPMLRRNTVLDEVERFHQARSLTTTWSTEPQQPLRLPTPDDEDLTG